jgi:hypothetical protein
MSSRVLALDYDGERVTFDVEGDTAWGDPGVLLDRDDNLFGSSSTSTNCMSSPKIL